MKINKSLDIDLNIISPQKHIRIHEGDVDSVDILIGVTVDDESVDLTGVTIKYDATINNYLAEQDADGSVVDDKISIPVTQNMTAMSGLLLIDVRMIQNDQILFTQTICATVEKAVVNGSTYIDFSKVTIIQRMNALEDKMDYIEELVENFDTSKLIVSVNRPPEGAPAEVDVDLLRVGDTWVLSGANIVYKLVNAQYNYQPVPSAEPYHKFTWQPLNERYGVGNTEPPTTVTYQAVIYTINEVQWSWLPVPEYFKGDHYQMLVDGESTYYICKSGTMASTGVCTYTWREEGGSIDAYTKAETNELLADKMDLAPLNPTAEQIAAMAGGQLYGDKIAQDEYDEALAFKLPQGFYYEGVLKFFSAHTSDSRYPRVYRSQMRPLIESIDFSPKVGSFWLYYTNDDSVQSLYVLSHNGGSGSSQYWRKLNNHINVVSSLPVSDPMPYKTNYSYEISGHEIPPYDVNDEIIVSANGQVALYKCLGYNKVYDSSLGGYKAVYNWREKSRVYTKTEVDNLISAISTLSFEVAQTKPVSNIKTNVIYLIPKSTAETDNIYEEWIYVNNAWELIGSTEIDLSNYYTKSEIDNNYFDFSTYNIATVIYSNNLALGNALRAKTYEEIPIGYSFLAQESIDDGVTIRNIGMPRLAIRTGLTSYEFVNVFYTGSRSPTSSPKFEAQSGAIFQRIQNDSLESLWINRVNNDWSRIALYSDVNNKEDQSNKVTSLSSSSTDAQYPSAKCVYDMIGDIETALSEV